MKFTNITQRWFMCGKASRQGWFPCVLVLCVLVFPAHLWAQHTWRIETVDNGNGDSVGKSASLVIDQQGNVHIGYYDETRRALLYVYKPAGDSRWFKMAVEPKGVGGYVSLAVDAQARPHFSWISRVEDGLHYAYYDGKEWHKNIIDPAHAGYYNNIEVDQAGHPRISYYEDYGPTGHYALHLKYAYYDGRQWYIQTLDRRQGTGKSNSLALDSSGNPCIAYTHVGLGDLLFAHWDGSRWTFGDADSRRTHNSYVGMGNSIALDSAGHPHIAYMDMSLLRIKYTHFNGSVWQTEFVAKVSDHADMDHVSLKLDSHNRPHLAFYDAGVGALNYAVRDEKGWHIEVVDHDGNVGMFPSLWLDSQDQPHIAYYDVDRHALKLADSMPSRPVIKAEK